MIVEPASAPTPTLSCSWALGPRPEKSTIALSGTAPRMGSTSQPVRPFHKRQEVAGTNAPHYTRKGRNEEKQLATIADHVRGNREDVPINKQQEQQLDKPVGVARKRGRGHEQVAWKVPHG